MFEEVKQVTILSLKVANNVDIVAFPSETNKSVKVGMSDMNSNVSNLSLEPIKLFLYVRDLLPELISLKA